MATAVAAGVESSDAAKSVEELSAAASSPPEKYILKDGIGGADFPVMDVAVIDVARLTSSSLEGEKEVEKLGLALSDCGYIQVSSFLTNSTCSTTLYLFYFILFFPKFNMILIRR